jgi:hypothetical protein
MVAYAPKLQQQKKQICPIFVGILATTAPEVAVARVQGVQAAVQKKKHTLHKISTLKPPHP